MDQSRLASTESFQMSIPLFPSPFESTSKAIIFVAQITLSGSPKSMEGELKDSDRKKRPRNEGKEEEMEALAAAVSARPRLVGPQNPFGGKGCRAGTTYNERIDACTQQPFSSLSVTESLLARPMPMEDIIRRSNETNLPAASATIPQILAGAFRCYSGTLSANTSRSSCKLSSV